MSVDIVDISYVILSHLKQINQNEKKINDINSKKVVLLKKMWVSLKRASCEFASFKGFSARTVWYLFHMIYAGLSL